MRKIEGDLIQLAQHGEFDAIVHGCNCFCKMGAGIAKTVKKVFPEAYTADCNTAKGSSEKLGTCSVATCEVQGGNCDIINAYTQHHYGGKKPIDYEALRRCMKWIKLHYHGKKIALPKIGAGLAGGDWPTIEKIIAEELHGEDVTVVIFKKS